MSYSAQSPNIKQLKRKHKRSAPSDGLYLPPEQAQLRKTIHLSKQQNCESSNPKKHKNKSFTRKHIGPPNAKSSQLNEGSTKIGVDKNSTVVVYPLKSTNDTVEKSKRKKDKLSKTNLNRSQHSKSLIQDYPQFESQRLTLGLNNNHHPYQPLIRTHKGQKNNLSAPYKKSLNLNRKSFVSSQLNTKYLQSGMVYSSARVSLQDRLTDHVLKSVIVSNGYKKKKLSIDELKNIVKNIVMDQLGKIRQQFPQKDHNTERKPQKVLTNRDKNEPNSVLPISKLASLHSMNNSFYCPRMQSQLSEESVLCQYQKTDVYRDFIDKDLQVSFLQEIKRFSQKNSSHHDSSVISALKKDEIMKNRKQKMETQSDTKNIIASYINHLKSKPVKSKKIEFFDFESNQQREVSQILGNRFQIEDNFIGINEEFIQQLPSKDHDQMLVSPTKSQLMFVKLANGIRQQIAAKDKRDVQILTYIYSFLENGSQVDQLVNHEGKQQQQSAAKITDTAFEQERDAQVLNSVIKIDMQHKESSDLSSLNSSSLNLELNQAKNVNFEVLEEVLIKRQRRLEKQRQNQLGRLQEKRDAQKITVFQYTAEKQNIQKWIRLQLNQISKVRRDLTNNYNEVKNLLDKTSTIDDDTECTQFTQGIMKCLSEKYLKSPFPLDSVSNKEPECALETPKKQQPGSDIINLESLQIIKEAISQMKQKNMIQQHQEEGHQIHMTPQSQEQDMREEDEYHSQRRLRRYKFSDSSEQQRESQTSSSKSNNSQPQGSPSATHLPKQSNQPLKNLQVQVKQDIYQFVFLDLCVQMMSQHGLNKNQTFLSLLRKCCEDHKKELNRRKGVKTDLKTIKDFLSDLHSFVSERHKGQLNKLQVPVGPTAQEILKYMHQVEYEEDPNSQGVAVKPVYENEIFQQFQQIFLPSVIIEKYYENEQKQKNRKQFLRNALFVFHKALFDSLNQSLDKRRLYGKEGKPFPWKNNSQFHHFLTMEQKHYALKQSFSAVYIDSSYMCGIMADKQDSLFIGRNVSETYIEHIRQDRVGRMMANDLIENQFKWLFYDDDQAEVLLQLSKTIQKQLILQEIITIKQLGLLSSGLL